MPRPRRHLLAGGYYHLINRGNNRSLVFRRPGDYRSFLALVDQAQQRVRLQILAFCLMPSHFHLVVSPRRQEDVSQWMHWLTTTHAHRQHLRYGTSGCVWQGRFKSFQITTDGHLLTVMRYVERNALRAGLVERAEEWPWGSLALRMTEITGARLADPPFALPSDWAIRVNAPQTPAELAALRKAVNRQTPFDFDPSQEDAAGVEALSAPRRGRGRPRKAPQEK
ncbi:MAG: transposase [Steroidobacteraceae bacterium]